VHRWVSIPPKYSVAHTVGLLKGKRAVTKLHRELVGERRMPGLHCWASSDCVSTLGSEDQAVRRYVCEQQAADSGQARFDLNLESSLLKPQPGFPIVCRPPLAGFLKPPALRVVDYSFLH
jgi:putative transposase